MSTAEKTSSHQSASVYRAPNVKRMASYTLTDPEVSAKLVALEMALIGSKEESIKFLKKVGIINRSGKLAKNFGG